MSLKVAGPLEGVRRFAVTTRRNPSRFFRADMCHGEGGDLGADRSERVHAAVSIKRYRFQVRIDDGHGHFKTLSTDHPSLVFLLTYIDLDCGQYKSWLLHRGTSKKRVLPTTTAARIAKQSKDSDDPLEDFLEESLLFAACEALMHREMIDHVKKTNVPLRIRKK